MSPGPLDPRPDAPPSGGADLGAIADAVDAHDADAGSHDALFDAQTAAAAAALAAHDADALAHATAFDAFAATELQHSPDFLHDYFLLYDDFLGDNIATGNIGQYGWTLTTAATGAAAVPASDNGGPGHISLNVPANGDTAEILLNTMMLTGSPLYVVEWRIRQSSALTTCIGRWGLTTASTAAPAGGAYFETGATNYRFITRAASGTPQTTDTGVPVDTTWNTFRIESDGSSAITAFVNGVEIAAPHTTRSTADVCTFRMGHRRTSSSGTAMLRCDYVWAKVATPRGDV